MLKETTITCLHFTKQQKTASDVFLEKIRVKMALRMNFINNSQKSGSYKLQSIEVVEKFSVLAKVGKSILCIPATLTSSE